MKILVLTNLYPPHYVGGYELICAAMVAAWRARGHQVEVLTSNHRVDGVREEGPEPGVSRTLRVHGFFGHPWLGIRELANLEIHNNRCVREAVARIRPDVVHVWNLGGISKSICLTLQDLPVPTAYHLSDHWIARSLAADVWLDWWNRGNPSSLARLLRTVWNWSGRRRKWSAVAPTGPVRSIRFDRISFCSRALRDLTAAKGYSVGHGAIIYCPVDIGRFSGTPAPASQLLHRLLYVGRLAEDKGVMTALRAMAAVQGRFPGELHVYGRGDADYTDRLHAYVREHHLPVFFHTARSSEMPNIYRAHDALLFTSEWEEPFALTPLEAMSSGLPVIGTMTGGSPELFRHGENALTYPAGDADQLAERIVELAADPVARARIAATGHAEVRSRYNEPVIVEQFERYLLETIALAQGKSPAHHPPTPPPG